jgi:hypothetical protein
MQLLLDPEHLECLGFQFLLDPEHLEYLEIQFLLDLEFLDDPEHLEYLEYLEILEQHNFLQFLGLLEDLVSQTHLIVSTVQYHHQI